MLTRLISGIVMLIILGVALTMGKGVLWALLLFISLVGLYEFYRATGKKDRKHSLEIAGYIGTLVYYIMLYFEALRPHIFVIAVLILVVMMFIYVLSYPTYQAGEFMSTYFGILYIPVMFSFIYLTREYDYGEYLVYLIFISAWACDTFAYVFGKLFGKHKLAPVLSPKKSIEGAIGGLVGACAVGALIGWMFYYFSGQPKDLIWMFALIGTIGGIPAQIGDLTASAIKRSHGIKDYGKLIPGHGGILDRFDSVIATAPMTYALVLLMVHRI